MGREKLTSRTAVRSRAGVWKRIVFCLACGVVFCTTYALILPAITLEKTELKCPYIVHTHTEACYDPAAAEPKKLLCGQADFVVHTHGPGCRDEAGKLCCPLPERKVHEHGPECYTKPLVCDQAEVAGHTHTDACYTDTVSPEGEQVQGTLTCGEEETPGHTHTDTCYGPEVLACGQEEIQLHTHDDGCYAWTEGPDGEKVRGDLICDKLEVLEHVHRTGENGCFQTVTVPDTPTGDPTDQPTQGDPANPDQPADDGTTSGEPGEPQPTCGKKEHVHEEGCYDHKGKLICELEAHTHDTECYLNQEEPSEDLLESGGGNKNPGGFSDKTWEELQEYKIYLGTKQGDGTWLLMDGEDEESSEVKAVVTLPEGTPEPKGHYLFIRKINPNEGFYPKKEAVKKEAGEINGYQCYTIRWIGEKKVDDGKPALDMKPLNSGLPEGEAATVEITYLKEGARLPGPAGGRKLLIYNSNDNDSLQDKVADTVKNVQVEGDFYKSFTFSTINAGPYVFVSKKLEKGYIQALSISNMVDGSAPFDKTGDLVNGQVGQIDKPGNDSGPSNHVVRSYDTIQYTLAATFGAREEGVTQETVKMYFELTLSKSATAARFDTSKMLWLGEKYSVEYLSESGNVIMIMAHNGKYYAPQKNEDDTVKRDENGFAQPDMTHELKINAYLSGSTAGQESYKVSEGSIARQRLVGWTELQAKEGENILSGTQSFAAAVQVRNADNGEFFAPTFRLWLEGNEDNYGPETRNSEGSLTPATPEPGNKVDILNDDNHKKHQVTVSAGTNFNVRLGKNGDMSYKNWFDFSTGNVVKEPDRAELEHLAAFEENRGKSNPAEFTESGEPLDAGTQAKYQNYRYGRITCYGITLQLYNDTDNNPDANRASKGLKGFSLPVGDITFDLNFRSAAAKGSTSLDDTGAYPAILWDYNENVPANSSYSYSYVDPGRGKLTTPNNGLGNGGRNLYWDGETRSPYAKGAAPSNYIAYHDGCYYGGNWALVDEKGNKADIGQVANPTAVTGTGGDTTYHFKVSDYDFDFDTQHFPLRHAGDSGEVTGYNTYVRCFSAGCVQVLSVFPRVQKESEAKVELNTTVSNLRLETRAGQVLEAKADDASKIEHEVNRGDNSRNDQIVLYAPGTLTKGSAFNGKYKGNVPNTTTEGFLGTDYWTTSYDCSAFAGDEIWIVSYGMMNPGSDYRTRSMNLLQLFDSRALRIREKPNLRPEYDPDFGDEAGTASYLYAADPDYPEGYDTTHQDESGKYDVLKYMNGVREEDLAYSTEIPDEEGYITVTVDGKSERMKCVGVLMELRGCNLLGGKYQYLRIPVKVNGDDPELVGKTVATVNTFRAWSYNLEKNGEKVTWKNGVWTNGENKLDGYSKPGNETNAEFYSGRAENSTNGSPLEYVKTEYKDGEKVNGTHTGTLSGNSLLILSYKAHVGITVDKKNTTGSITYDQSKGQNVVDYRLRNIKTEVSDATHQKEMPPTTLTVKAVLDEKNTTGKQRISVAAGTYRMKGYQTENATGEPEDILISSDQEHPTTLWYKDANQKSHKITVYAQRAANDRSVTFTIQNAPVGVALPDITFQANFSAVTALKENDTIQASAYISGAGDQRAYDVAKGNEANITVGVVLGSGTNLTKAVDKRYIELNGEFAYDVVYTNSGTQTIEQMFFYDLLPSNGDIRASRFAGKATLGEVKVTVTQDEAGDAPLTADVYYSTTEYGTLYDMVKTFGGTWVDGKPRGMNTQAIQTMLSNNFRKLGTVSSTGFQLDEAYKNLSPEEKNKITGLYVVANNLSKMQTITLEFSVKPNGSEVGNLYCNIANSWIADSGTLPLTSNRVETQTIGRTISGVVWADLDGDGVRKTNEKAIPNVECALFKKDDSGKYVLQTQDIQGNPIGKPSGSETTGTEGTGTGIVTTDENGAYAFHRLPAGDYVVAFKGDALQPYSDATQYQVHKMNDPNTNDGKKNTSTFNGIGSEYRYCIHYCENSSDIKLHTLKEIQSGTVPLTNATETVSNQDLGLVYGYELPETGGEGLLGYVLGGGLLAVGALVGLLLRRGRGAA